MEILGYCASVLIGVSLGLLGGGGSILTVPVLVYFFGIDPVSATTYSLFIVGMASLTGSIASLSKKVIDYQVVLLLGLPSIATIFLIRRFLLPNIPEILFQSAQFRLLSRDVLMIAFAVVMLLSAFSMIKRKREPAPPPAEAPRSLPVLLFPGIVLGCITGLLGAGGGFLIIPVLVLWLKLPMKNAIGTSLAIISINSMLGFSFSIGSTSIQWNLFSSVTAIAVGGILIGSRLAARMDSVRLKRGFGIFVLVVAACIVMKELFIR